MFHRISRVSHSKQPLDTFSIRGTSDCEHRDERGTALLNDIEALDHALSKIKSLRSGGEHDAPGWMMIVRNETFETILSLPFLAGCA